MYHLFIDGTEVDSFYSREDAILAISLYRGNAKEWAIIYR